MCSSIEKIWYEYLSNECLMRCWLAALPWFHGAFYRADSANSWDYSRYYSFRPRGFVVKLSVMDCTPATASFPWYIFSCCCCWYCRCGGWCAYASAPGLPRSRSRNREHEIPSLVHHDAILPVDALRVIPREQPEVARDHRAVLPATHHRPTTTTSNNPFAVCFIPYYIILIY